MFMVLKLILKTGGTVFIEKGKHEQWRSDVTFINPKFQGNFLEFCYTKSWPKFRHNFCLTKTCKQFDVNSNYNCNETFHFTG